MESGDSTADTAHHYTTRLSEVAASIRELVANPPLKITNNTDFTIEHDLIPTLTHKLELRTFGKFIRPSVRRGRGGHDRPYI